MKALFFGLGGVGQRHLRNLRQLVPDAEVAAVRHLGRTFEIGNDLATDMGVNVVAKYGVIVFHSLEEAGGFDPDFAVVASPSSRHVKTALALVERGVPVFVDKPAAVGRGEFAALEKAAAELDVPVMVGYQFRWHPCVRQARELLLDGRIGRVQSAEVSVHSHMPSWHAYEKPNQSYAGLRALGGGVVLTEIHEIDLLCWFFGRPKRVFATGGRVSDLEIDVEDTVSVALEMEANGRSFPLSLTLSFVQRPPARRFAINGADGKILLEISKPQVRTEDAEGTEIDRLAVPEFDRNCMFVQELEHFLACLSGGVEPDTSLARVRDGQFTAQAILESLASGRPETP